MSAYAGRGLHGQTVEEIGGRIVCGRYEPGAALFAEMLEKELDVSKTVVREALKVLAAKGLVESRQKRGTVVLPRRSWRLLDTDVLRWQGASSPDFTFFENLGEVRSIIEPAAVQLAAKRRTDSDIASLEAALDAMSTASADADAVAEADVRFHRALLDAAHNEILSEMEVVLAAGLHVRDRFVHNNRKPSDSIPAHRALLNAVRDGDTVLAVQTIEKLLTQADEDLAAARHETDIIHPD